MADPLTCAPPVAWSVLGAIMVLFVEAALVSLAVGIGEIRRG